MKKAILGALFAGAMLASCSSDEPVVGPDNGQEGEPRFMTVNIVTAKTTPTRSRAAGDQTTGDPNRDATYEEGLTDENKVNSIRFYFFNADGTAASVKKAEGGAYHNYVDWTENINEEGNQMPNVEKIISATIVINTKEGDKTPAYMIAIVNGTRSESVSYTLEHGDNPIHNVAKDYISTIGTYGFTMTNATYKDEVNKVTAVSVTGKMFSTPGEALNNPVIIHVEREVAKVRLQTSLTETSSGSGIYATSTKDKKQEVTLDGENKEIYVKLLGWNTTAVANKMNTIKNINTDWAANLLGEGTPWNWAEYFRSFWAINPTGVGYDYGAFNEAPTDDAIKNNIFTATAKTKFDKSEWVYVNENAAPNAEGSSASTPTKVIIAAQLVDASGNALEFAEYGTTRTTINGLKNIFANNCGLWQEDPTNKNHRIHAKPEDLEIKTAQELGKADASTPGRYKVYVQLSSTAADKKWYSSSEQSQTTALSTTAANQKLLDLGSAKVWKDGYTYYYFDIKHLGNKVGVVRNHIYDSNITVLSGLGTPIYNPKEVIYPEKPNDDPYTYIAAQIKILSWRVVSNDEELKW